MIYANDMQIFLIKFINKNIYSTFSQQALLYHSNCNKYKCYFLIMPSPIRGVPIADSGWEDLIPLVYKLMTPSY